MLNILEAIKSEKKMSFRHWRYRLLHWAFGIRPTSPVDSKLPSFLYTHYCPLFHLTNLIAIFAPIILLYKLFWFVMVAVLTILVLVVSGVRKVVARLQKVKPAKIPQSKEEVDRHIESIRASLRAEELRGIPALIARFGRLEKGVLTDFDWFIGSCPSDSWLYINKKDIRPVWETYAPKVLASLKVKEERQKKMRQFIIFWVNISRIFIKGFFNLCYLALFAGVVYLTVVFGWPGLKVLVETFGWLFVYLASLNWLAALMSVLTWGLRFIIGIITVTSVIWLLYRYVPWHHCQRILPPFVAVWDAVVACGRYVGGVFTSGVDFIKLFYEENCPPITIVDDDTAALAAIEEETV